MPLPLLAVLGAGVADCRLLLFVDDAELELVVVAVDVVVFRAVLEELDDDLPAYEAAAA
ncbi:MAG TPA: hypothetical protein VGR77_03880 [Candidatus Dormibacteraeota bacterium]|nr:hypothetical protein [Candidatus Dormibacteraeota bacterium]